MTHYLVQLFSNINQHIYKQIRYIMINHRYSYLYQQSRTTHYDNQTMELSNSSNYNMSTNIYLLPLILRLSLIS